MLSDRQLLKYSRQVLLPDIDVQGQEKLLAAKVLVIGLGGLGSPVAMYLAAAGVGELVLVDDDIVELSNLQRQIIHDESAIGLQKVASAAQRIGLLNADTKVQCIPTRLSESVLSELLKTVSLVVDCSDNFSTRFMINKACVMHKVPLVSGAAIRMEGQLLTIDPRVEQSPCYQCLYPQADNENLSCSESGVLAPLVGVIGSMQALEAIKVLVGMSDTLVGRLLVFDGKSMQWQTLKLKRDTFCAVCAGP
jgi:adenylyltransferase/sulfurtransferase